jgi:threonine/homoserine/homoserine lactone efflux protein
MHPDTWCLFFLTAIGIALSPGPNGLLAMTQGAIHGFRQALFTIAGALIGFAVVISVCVLGIGALIKSSVLGFLVLQWVGGGYLVFLGIKLWRARPIELQLDRRPRAVGRGVLFRQGLVCALTNPKSLLLFSALLPQFIDPTRHLGVQCGVMASTYALVEGLVQCGLAMAANQLSPWLAREREGRLFNRACGGVFVGIGLLLPWRG